jgi:SOS-response transcriptional repressor LexA
VCFLDGEFTVKKTIKSKVKIYLKLENKEYDKIEIIKGNELIIWDIITYVIKSL